MKNLKKTFNKKKVIITGHTGFKGSWLTLWLLSLGAKVTGISNEIATSPSHYKLLNIKKKINDKRLDLSNYNNLKKINKIVGNNTITAVRSGFFWGYSGLIDNIIRLIKNENNKNFNTIITGGLSNLFQTSIKTKVKLNKDITVKGLIKISRLID